MKYLYIYEVKKYTEFVKKPLLNIRLTK